MTCLFVFSRELLLDSRDALPSAGIVLGIGSFPGEARFLSHGRPRTLESVVTNIRCEGGGARAVLLEQRTPVRQRALSEQGAHLPALRIRYLVCMCVCA